MLWKRGLFLLMVLLTVQFASAITLHCFTPTGTCPLDYSKYASGEIIDVYVSTSLTDFDEYHGRDVVGSTWLIETNTGQEYAHFEIRIASGSNQYAFRIRNDGNTVEQSSFTLIGSICETSDNPSVSITSPIVGSDIFEDDDFTVRATGSTDTDSKTITRLEFKYPNSGNWIKEYCTPTSPSCTLEHDFRATESGTIYVRAYDSAGCSYERTRTITVIPEIIDDDQEFIYYCNNDAETGIGINAYATTPTICVGTETYCETQYAECSRDQGTDCNDNNAQIHVGATEVCDGIDNNCVNGIDEGCDSDLDGYIDNSAGCTGTPQCRNNAGVLFAGTCHGCSQLDCHDGDASITTGQLYYFDHDDDGYGLSSTYRTACIGGEYTATVGGDQDDNDDTIYPGAPELCDGKDNDQNGVADNGVTVYFKDADNDNFPASNDDYLCEATTGYTKTRDEFIAAQQILFPGDTNIPYLDFKDDDGSIYPNAPELCDGKDNDNDGVFDEDFDKDGDTYTDCGTRSDRASTPNQDLIDCNDAATVSGITCPTLADITNSGYSTACLTRMACGICQSPGWTAYTLCTGVDVDCDGLPDVGTNCQCTTPGTTQSCTIADAYGPCKVGTQTCSGDGQWSTCQTTVQPQTEACVSTTDSNCDGVKFGAGRTAEDCEPTATDKSCKLPLEDKDGKIAYCLGTRVADQNGYWTNQCDCTPYIEIQAKNFHQGYTFDANVESSIYPRYEIKSNLIQDDDSSAITVVASSNALATKGTLYQGKEINVPITEYTAETSITVRAFLFSPEAQAEGVPLLDEITFTYVPQVIAEEDKETVGTVGTTATDEEKQDIVDRLKNSSQQSTKESIASDEETDQYSQTGNTAEVIQDKSTRVTSTIEAEKGKVLKDVTLAIDIPKCAAELVNEINFDNDNYELIDEDPLIAWHFTEVTDKIDLTYELEKKLDKECLDKLRVISLIEDIDDDAAQNSPLIALLVIPAVIFAVIMLTKFTSKEHVDISVDEDHVLNELHEIVKHRLSLGEDPETILTDLQAQGFDKNLIKESFKRHKVM